MATTLSAGDIQITGFNFDNPDDFSFVVLTDLSSGTAISFTDDGVNSNGTFRGSGDRKRPLHGQPIVLTVQARV